jgi:hypothetical protein
MVFIFATNQLASVLCGRTGLAGRVDAPGVCSVGAAFTAATIKTVNTAPNAALGDIRLNLK